jgi:lipopolysaccharide/colanic/teichoic acid biosynthesis glycosyltransferase
MAGTDLSIVIVPYRCDQLLRACLKSRALAAEDFFEAAMENRKILRKTSLDKLPQLWNLVRGHMSLVRPRALTGDELGTHCGASTKDVLAVRPGITGYRQINRRSRLGYDGRVRVELR